MRITQSMMTQDFLYNITNDNNRMANLENQLSTGKTLNEPSDNPLAVSQDMSINATLSETTGYQNAISQGLTWMNSTSAALSNLNSALQQIQEVTLNGVNGTNQDPAALNALSATAQQMVGDVSQIMDSQQGTRYLFGGTATQTAPSTYLLGSTLSAPTGASSNLSLLVAAGIEIPVNVTATSLMLTIPSGGTADLSQTLTSIVADLKTGNQGNLSTDLQNLNAGMSQVTGLEADLGSREVRMNALNSQMSQYSNLVTNEKGVIEDANMAQVITQFNTDQTVYQAALKLGSQVLLPTLVSYLP